jgi:beta-mannosidase
VLSTAYRLWRRNFKGPGKEYTAGALVWQLNDVYPATSWSIVDYYMRPKPAVSSSRCLPSSALSELTLSSTLWLHAVLRHQAVDGALDRRRQTLHREGLRSPTETEHVDIWACSSTLALKEALLVVEAFELMSGQRIYIKQDTVIVEPNRSTELTKLEVPKFKARLEAAVVASAKLVDPDTKEVLSRFAVWPEP